MATAAQIDANRLNAQRSTGPRTPEGKAAVAQNRTTHGLTGQFTVLPSEDREAFDQLLEDYRNEYRPITPTQHFFVTELAQAQWRIMRAGAIEAELLNPGEQPSYASIAAAFRDSDAITRLDRYAQAARRAYYKAHEKLLSIAHDTVRRRREDSREFDRRAIAYIEAPLPTPDQPVQIPMHPEFERELEYLLSRDPGFDPHRDASQMSNGLRHWFERHAAA